MTRQTRYAPEVRARAVRMVFEHRGEHASEWAAISSIAAKIGCTAETLRGRVGQAERDQGQRAGPTSEERARIKSLEREVRELRQANEILRQASAYFAMAELDRGSKPSTAAPSIRFRQEAAAPGAGRERVRRGAPRRPRGRADLPAAADRSVDVPRARRPPARALALARSGRVRHPRLGRLVQSPAPARAHRLRPPGRGRSRLLQRSGEQADRRVALKPTSLRQTRRGSNSQRHSRSSSSSAVG